MGPAMFIAGDRIEATAAAADFRQKADLIEHKLDEVHQVASEAKHEAQVAVEEANHTNEKIESTNAKIESIVRLFEGSSIIKDIDETTKRTDATVSDIQETLGNASADKNTT